MAAAKPLRVGGGPSPSPAPLPFRRAAGVTLSADLGVGRGSSGLVSWHLHPPALLILCSFECRPCAVAPNSHLQPLAPAPAPRPTCISDLSGSAVEFLTHHPSQPCSIRPIISPCNRASRLGTRPGVLWDSSLPLTLPGPPAAPTPPWRSTQSIPRGLPWAWGRPGEHQLSPATADGGALRPGWWCVMPLRCQGWGTHSRPRSSWVARPQSRALGQGAWPPSSPVCENRFSWKPPLWPAVLRWALPVCRCPDSTVRLSLRCPVVEKSYHHRHRVLGPRVSGVMQEVTPQHPVRAETGCSLSSGLRESAGSGPEGGAGSRRTRSRELGRQPLAAPSRPLSTRR